MLNARKIYASPWLPTTPREQQRRSARARAVLLAAGVGTVLAALVVLRFARGFGEPLDAALCATQGSLPAHMVVLVDATDRLSDAQQKLVKQLVREQADRLPPHQRLSLLALSPDENRFTRILFSVCKPRDGSDADPLTENKQLLEHAYRERFLAPLDAALDTLEQLPAAASSPILEALHEVVSQRSFADAEQRRLVVVSDLLQHSAVLSQYRQDYDFAPLRQHSLYVTEVEAALRRAEVRVYQLTSAASRRYQTPAHTRFWVEYLHYAGVTEPERLVVQL